MIGADIVLTFLEKQGIQTIFGVPGEAFIPLYDRMKNFGINHILAKQEQGAIHAADGYARRSGDVGVYFSASSPGATNLMTGLVNAQMDSVPIVVITSQLAGDCVDNENLPEAFVTGITQPVCKHSIMVTDAMDLPQVLTDAFYIAQNSRPGPVVVDIPADVFSQEVPEPDFSCEPRKRYVMKLKNGVITRDMVRKVAHLIDQSKKPLFIVGGGANTIDNNRKYLHTLSERWTIPVTFTLMGNGLIDADSPYFLGMAGIHGTKVANYAIEHADLLVAIGAGLDDHIAEVLRKNSSQVKIIHVDIDVAEIGKNIKVDMPIVGDAADFLKQLVSINAEPRDRSKWLHELSAHKGQLAISKNGYLSSVELFPYLKQFIKDQTVVVTDAGQHQIWSGLYLTPKGTRRFIASGGLGTMGFGLPAAIGAQFAKAKDKVIFITGNENLQMNMQELAVIKEFQMPIKILLMNNQQLNIVKKWESFLATEEEAFAILDTAPEWEDLAKAYSIHYQRVQSFKEAEDTVPELLMNDKPVLIDFRIDPAENVFSMLSGRKI